METGSTAPIDDLPKPSPIKLKAEHIRAIAMRLEGESRKVIAERLDVTERTLCTWFASDTFKIALSEAKTCRIEHITERITAFGDEAIAVLQKLMQASDSTQETKRYSARVLVAAMLQAAGISAPVKLAGHDGGPLETDPTRRIMELCERDPDIRAQALKLSEMVSLKDKPVVPQ
jgi:hypothetical protein